MKFKVKNKNEKSSDIIMRLESPNLKTAIKHASIIKNLSEDQFVLLFKIEVDNG
tara:strand:+ start:387 stop:548 length:162 start_codon:yes stop_codon:yes gene_type:complete